MLGPYCVELFARSIAFCAVQNRSLYMQTILLYYTNSSLFVLIENYIHIFYESQRSVVTKRCIRCFPVSECQYFTSIPTTTPSPDSFKKQNNNKQIKKELLNNIKEKMCCSQASVPRIQGAHFYQCAVLALVRTSVNGVYVTYRFNVRIRPIQYSQQSYGPLQHPQSSNSILVEMFYVLQRHKRTNYNKTQTQHVTFKMCVYIYCAGCVKRTLILVRPTYM